MAYIFVLHEKGSLVFPNKGKSQPKVYTSEKNAQIGINNLDSYVHDKQHMDIVKYCPANDAVTHTFIILEIDAKTLLSKVLPFSYTLEETAKGICNTLAKIHNDKSYITQKVSINI